MRLLRLGLATINADLITCIRDVSDRDAAGQVTRGLFRVEFGRESHVDISTYYNEFNTWLAANSTLLAPPPA